MSKKIIVVVLLFTFKYGSLTAQQNYCTERHVVGIESELRDKNINQAKLLVKSLKELCCPDDKTGNCKFIASDFENTIAIKEGKNPTPILINSNTNKIFAKRKLIAVKGTNGKYGFKDEKGDLKIVYKYDDAEDFDFELSNLTEVYKGDNLGYIDDQGKEIPNFLYLEIKEQNGINDIVDVNGKSVFPPDNKELTFADDNDGDIENIGLSIAVVKSTVTNKYGLYDCKEKRILKPLVYDNIDLVYYDWQTVWEYPLKKGMSLSSFYSFFRNETLLILGFNGKYSLEKIFATTSIKNLYDEIDNFVYGGLIEVENNGKKGFINTKGQEVIKLIYDDVRQPKNGLIAVKKEELFGFIDYNENLIIKYQFRDILRNSETLNTYDSTYFVNGLCAVSDYRNKWGFIDKEGIFKIQPQFEEVKHFCGNVAPVNVGENNWKLINKLGDFIELKQKYSKIDVHDSFESTGGIQYFFLVDMLKYGSNEKQEFLKIYPNGKLEYQKSW